MNPVIQWTDAEAAKAQLDAWTSDASEKELRKARLDQFLQKGFPTTKHEEWKYTSVQSAVSTGRQLAIDSKPFSSDAWEKQLLNLPEASVIVLLNGQYSPKHSKNLEQDTLTVRTAEAKDFQLESAAESAFVALNSSFSRHAVLIDVKARKTVAHPLLLVHVSQGDRETLLNGRVILKAGEGSNLTVIEQYVHLGGDVLDNEVLEIEVGKGAQVEHHVVQASEEAQIISFTRVTQGHGSTYRSMVLSTEGKLVRNNLHVHHDGQHCETYLNGLYLLGGNSHVDNHTLVDHAHPNCYSNELYKGVLGNKSTAVFNGKVLVRLDAQKTNAFQSNRTVLLDQGARMNTKPQLEIFADDVKCSHGATTGRLDEEALFYLRSRGLTHQAAMSLLTLAFAAEVLEKLDAGPIREHLKSIVENKLSDLAKPA